MTALALTPVQPDESDITTAVEALPHVKDYLATHTDSVIRLVPPLILTVAEADEIVALLAPIVKAFLAEPAQ